MPDEAPAPERPFAERAARTARIAVRWSDLDALGHVNNAAYLTYCEQARIEALTELDPEWWGRETGVGPVVARAAVVYKRPITEARAVWVRVAVGEPERTSAMTRYELRAGAEDGPLCATAEALLVWVSAETGRPASLPASLRAALAEG